MKKDKKTTAKVLFNFLERHGMGREYHNVVEKYPPKVIRVALKNNACLNYKKLIECCNYYSKVL